MREPPTGEVRGCDYCIPMIAGMLNARAETLDEEQLPRRTTLRAAIEGQATNLKIGAGGFEPPASRPQSGRSARLSYAPSGEG